MPETPRKPLHTRHIVTLSTVVSVLAICGVVLPVVGTLASPWAVKYMSTAMADEIEKQVERHLSPTNAGLKVLIESNIAQLEDDISQLEYRRQNQPASWTPLDAQTLTNKSRRLAAQRAALAAMSGAERANQ